MEELWVDIQRRKPKNSEKNLSQCNSISSPVLIRLKEISGKYLYIFSVFSTQEASTLDCKTLIWWFFIIVCDNYHNKSNITLDIVYFLGYTRYTRHDISKFGFNPGESYWLSLYWHTNIVIQWLAFRIGLKTILTSWRSLTLLSKMKIVDNLPV